MSAQVPIEALVDQLTRKAIQLGATGARAIAAGEIVVEENLARLCREPHRCENFGLAPSCPPHVGGPSGFRELLKDVQKALVIKIDVPLEILFSSQVREIMALLHEMVASLEHMSVERGYLHSKAFAGGSCKKIFCNDQPECNLLSTGAPCRHPHQARPSMSGFGINVTRLMQAAGWRMQAASRDLKSDQESTSPVCGLVLIG